MVAGGGWLGHDRRGPDDHLFAAHTALRDGQLGLAVSWFDRYLAERPRDATTRAVYGATLLQTGAADQGRQELERALDEDPGETVAAAWLARLTFEDGELDRARELAETALAGDTTSGHAQLVLGMIEHRSNSGDRMRALEHLRAAREAGVADAGTLVTLLELARDLPTSVGGAPTEVEREEWFDEARQRLHRRLASRDADPVGDAVLLSRAHAAVDDLAGALRALEDAPSSAPAVARQRTRVSMAAGRMDTAREALDESPLEAHDTSSALATIRLWTALGETDRATTALDELEQRVGSSPRIALMRFRVLRAQGADDQAVATLRAAHASHPDSTDVALLLADTLRASPAGRPEARKLLEGLLDGPHADDALLRLADSHLDEFVATNDERHLEQARSLAARLRPAPTTAILTGRLASLSGEHDEAARLLTTAARTRPDDAVASRMLADVHRARGDAVGETRALSEAVRRGADQPAVRLRRADAAIRAGWTEIAEQDARTILRADPDHPHAQLLLATIAGSDPLRAAEAIRQATALLTHEDVDVAVPAAGLVARLEDTRAEAVASEGALAAWRRVIVAHPGSIAARLQLASLLAGVARTEEAVAEIRAALELNPESVAARRIHFDALLVPAFPDVTDREEAQRLVNELERLAPASAATAYVRGGLALLDDPSAAADELRSVVARAPGDARAWLALGYALDRSGGTEEALNAVVRAVQLEPRLVSTIDAALTLLARSADERMAAGDVDAALEQAEELVEAGDEERWTRGRRAKLLFLAALRGRPELLERTRREADELLEESRGTEKERLAVGFAGDVAGAQGDHERELKLRRELVALAPESPVALRALARALVSTDELAAARETTARLVELDPESGASWALHAQVLASSGEEEAALAALGDATQAHPEEPGLWTRLGAIRERVGDPLGASQAYRRALALDTNSTEALLGVHRTLVTAGDPKGAIDELELARATSRHGGLILFLQSQTIRDTDAERAHELLGQALATGIDAAVFRAQATALRLQDLTEQGDHVAAAELADTFLAWEVRLPRGAGEDATAIALSDAANRAGLARAATREWEQAELAFRRAELRTPKAANVLNNLAYALQLQGKLDASRYSRRCVEIEEAVPEYWNTHASCLLADGRAQDAVDAWNLAAALYRGRLAIGEAGSHTNDDSAAALARTLVRRGEAQRILGDAAAARRSLAEAEAASAEITETREYRDLKHALATDTRR